MAVYIEKITYFNIVRETKTNKVLSVNLELLNLAASPTGSTSSEKIWNLYICG